MAGVLSLLLVLAIFVIEHTLYGWIAAKLLKYNGSWIRNFVIGCIGDFAATVVLLIVTELFKFLHINILVTMIMAISGILSLILPVLGSLVVMRIYKA